MDPNKLYQQLIASGMSPDSAEAEVTKQFGPPKSYDADTVSSNRFGGLAREPGVSTAVGREKRPNPIPTMLANAAQGATGGIMDEVGGFLEGAITPGLSVKEAIARNRAEEEEMSAEHPVISGASRVGGALTSAALTGPSLAAAGLKSLAGQGALYGGATAFGEAEGNPLERLPETAVGTAAGAVLGKAGEKIFQGLQKAAPFVRAAATPAGGTAAGAAVGGIAGDIGEPGIFDPKDAGKGALAGLAIGTAAKGGSAAVSRLLEAAGSPVAANRAIKELSKALIREGEALPAQIERTAANKVPGMTILDAGKPGGPLQRLGSVAESIGGKGGAEIRSVMAERSALEPNRFEKLARRAVGSKFRPPPKPKAQEARNIIRAESGPAYAAVSDEPVRLADPRISDALMQPEFREAYRELQEIAARPGSKTGALPDLFAEAEDGSVSLIGEELPVRTLDKIKRSVDDLIRKGQAGKTTLSEAKAEHLADVLGDMVSGIDEQVPGYATARGVHGKISQEVNEGLAKQAQTAHHVTQGSRTSVLSRGQEEFGASAKIPRSLNLKDLALNRLQSTLNQAIHNLDEATVNELAPRLLEDLTPETASGWVSLLKELAEKEASRLQRFGTVPRTAAAGAGRASAEILR